VQFDTYDGEAAMKDKVGPVIDRFVSAGVARESRGALVVEVSDVLGRPIAPCMLRKSDGATTYAARDCAAAIDRWEKHGFVANVYVCARQEDHFAQVFAALKKLAVAEKWDVCWPDRCENVSFGYVKGMSTRKGNAVWLDDVLNEAADRARQVRENRRSATPDTYPELPAAELDELCEAVGLAAVLFFDVSSNRLTDVTFDWDTVLQFDGKTGPYLQYTHARIAGLFRKAHAAGLGVDSPPTTALMSTLTSDVEWQLLFALRSFASEVCNAGEAREPRIVADYLFGLAGAFNRFYQKHPILHASDADTAVARLCLVRATQIVLRNGLRLLGIPAVEMM
jgi:arginyl-tRNA synthetase